MKVLIKIIISLFFLFSIVTTSFAQNKGQIDSILNLNYGIEKLEINFISLDSYTFNNSLTYNTYIIFKRATNSLKNEIIKQYESGKLGYYQTKGIISNYNNFIYYSNKYFDFIKSKETYPYDKAIDNAIINNLTQTKSYYMRIKYLVLRK